MDSVKRKLFQTPMKRKSTGQSSTLTKKQKQDVAKIAKKVTLRTAETKSAPNYNSMTPSAGDTVQVQNLNYFMGQGTTDQTYTGTEIFVKNMNIQMQVRRNGSASFGATFNDSVIARVIVFATKKALTNTTTSITASDLFRDDGYGSYRAQLVYPDLDKVKVLYDRKINISSPVATSTTVASPSNETVFGINLPINRKKIFDNDNSGYFKDANYYLAVVYTDSVGIPSYVTFRYNWVVNFKDL